MTTKTTPMGTALDAAANGLPYGFLEAVSDHGEAALSDWLHKNAPEDVYELFDCLLAVKANCEGLLRGATGKRTDSSLLEYVATIARVSNDLGVTWHGHAGPIIVRPASEPPFSQDAEATETANEPA